MDRVLEAMVRVPMGRLVRDRVRDTMGRLPLTVMVSMGRIVECRSGVPLGGDPSPRVRIPRGRVIGVHRSLWPKVRGPMARTLCHRIWAPMGRAPYPLGRFTMGRGTCS